MSFIRKTSLNKKGVASEYKESKLNYTKAEAPIKVAAYGAHAFASVYLNSIDIIDLKKDGNAIPIKFEHEEMNLSSFLPLTYPIVAVFNHYGITIFNFHKKELLFNTPLLETDGYCSNYSVSPNKKTIYFKSSRKGSLFCAIDLDDNKLTDLTGIIDTGHQPSCASLYPVSAKKVAFHSSVRFIQADQKLPLGFFSAPHKGHHPDHDIDVYTTTSPGHFKKLYTIRLEDNHCGEKLKYLNFSPDGNYLATVFNVEQGKETSSIMKVYDVRPAKQPDIKADNVPVLKPCFISPVKPFVSPTFSTNPFNWTRKNELIFMNSDGNVACIKQFSPADSNYAILIHQPADSFVLLEDGAIVTTHHHSGLKGCTSYSYHLPVVERRALSEIQLKNTNAAVEPSTAQPSMRAK